MESLFSLNQTAELLNSFPDPVFVLSRHGEYLAVFGGKDPRYYHDGSVLVGKSIPDMVVPDKANWFLEQIDRVLGSQGLHIFEYPLSGRDVKGLEEGPDDVLWFEGRVSRLPFLVEGKDAVLWVASNITERKRTRENLQQSEKTSRKLFTESADAILLIDSTGVFVECNQAALDLLKMTREQLLRLPPARISPEFQPDGRRSAETAPEMIALAYRKGLHRFDWTCVNAEGGEFIVEVSLMPIVIKGQTMLHTAWRDITRRIKSENALLARQKKQQLSLNKTIMLSGMHERPDEDVLNQILTAIVELTESEYGYLYFYDEETEIFTLHAWSAQVLGDCQVVDPQTRYSLAKTGFWGEVVRQRRSLINNDFAALHPLKKGYPHGHAPVHRFMSVPIMSGESIVAVAGVANKITPYSDDDAIGLQEFCQGAWTILRHRQEHRRLLDEQARYRQLFESLPIPCSVIELLFDDQGLPYDYRFTYINQGLADLLDLSREKVTGQTAKELFGGSKPEMLERFAEVVAKGVEAEFDYNSVVTGKQLLIRCYPAGGATLVSLALDVTASRKLMEISLRNEIESREREMFSRELHDSAGQTFQAIRLYLSLVEDGTIPLAEIPQAMAKLDEEVAEAFEELRELAHRLHPEFLLNTPLKMAISSRCKRFAQRGRPVAFSASGELPSLALEVRSNLYRISQEALNNAIRHSGASHIEVSLQGAKSGVLLKINDDGCGMRGRPEGFGVRSMRERAELIGARFTLESTPAGTCLMVEWRGE
ncbi:MAG: hypothetical protein C0614_11740 [Desulfuromonas sp.]|nr:MAG: hypothetical protein C0614_11740 [Desulfuromonas sp.]